MPELRTILHHYQPQILQLELAAWLHDLGKLHPKWIESIHGEIRWYHTDIFQEDKVEATYPQFYSWLVQNSFFEFPDGTNEDCVQSIILHHHGHENQRSTLDKLFVEADQNESGADKWGAIGNQPSDIYSSSPFGKETRIRPSGWDAARKEIYDGMPQNNEELIKNRRYIWGMLQKKYLLSVGLTFRSANDVHLDQHTWGVASRFKAMLLNEVLKDNGATPGADFRLFAVQWNYWEIVTPFARLMDLMGRQQLLSSLRADLRHELEDNLAIGNCVYEDDDGLFFMVPNAELSSQLVDIVREIIGRKEYKGEILPVIKISKETSSITIIINEKKALSTELPHIFVDEKGRPEADKTLRNTILCPVCHKRFLFGSEIKENVCNFCAGWRKIANRDAGNETIWNGEVADTHGRMALLVARFDLRKWLNGDMLYSVFSTCPKDHHQPDWLTLGQNLEQIIIRNDQRARVNEAIEYLRESHPGLSDADYQLLAIARKPPTTGRMLQIWRTTETFLKNQSVRVEHRIKRKKRIRFDISNNHINLNGFYKIEIPLLGLVEVYATTKWLQTVEAVDEETCSRLANSNESFNVQLTSDLPDQSIISVTLQKGRLISYIPIRSISTSPNLLLMLVPADQAFDIAQSIRKSYVKEFGKVQGRLPFHLGIIYMDAHYPMFAALDTARRMVEGFDQISDIAEEAEVKKKGVQRGGKIGLTLHSLRFKKFNWSVPTLLGNGEEDDYYPYFLIKAGRGLSERTMSLPDLENRGRWVHISQILKGDTLLFYPSCFDFIYLDTISRRLDVLPNEQKRRPHLVLDERQSTRPLLLERMPDLVRIWAKIHNTPKMSESRLRAASSLLSRKRSSWLTDLEKDATSVKAYHWLVNQVVRQDFGNSSILRDAIFEGTFFDVLELFRHILKYSLEEGEPR